MHSVFTKLRRGTDSKPSFNRHCCQSNAICYSVNITIVLMVMVELSETIGRGGGGRSGGSRGSRGTRSSRSRSRSGGSSSKPKITRYTPIKATSVRSPVIVKLTKLGSRSSTFKKVVVAYLVTRYAFSSAPVCRISNVPELSLHPEGAYVALVSIRSVIIIVVNIKVALYLAFRVLKSRI